MNRTAASIFVSLVPALSALGALTACGGSDSSAANGATTTSGGQGATNAVPNVGGQQSIASNGGNANAGAQSTSNPPSAAADFCSGKGPVVTVSDGATSSSHVTCTGRIAETKFLNALCTCNNATMAGYLKTRSFDSVKGGPTDTGGSVGINNAYAITTGFTDVGGSLTIAGPGSLSFAGYLKVGSDLRAAGEAIVAGYTKVGRNAWLGEGLTDLGPVNIGGDLHAAGPIMALPLQVGGSKFQENVNIPKTCPCEPQDLLDVGSLVDDAKLENDNAAHGISSNMLNLVVGNVEVTLPCGRFYLERIGGIGNTIVNVTGRVALFVDGPLAAAGNLEFRLAPAGEIDIFVKGDLVLTGRAVFGNKERPAASRIYVGGAGDVLLVGAGGFVGNVYAPHSLVTAVGYAEVYGSVFARDFLSPGYANFVYDRAIQHAGDNCDAPLPPPGTCNQCGSCTGGTACVNGSCGTCRTEGDCCSPLVCMNGVCAEPIVLM